MGQCWPLQMPPVPKAVLISLADQANDAGLCWPSVGNIAERTCYSERAIQEAISWLESNHAIRTEPRPGRSTHYYVTASAYIPPQEAHPAQGAPTPAPPAPPPPQEAHPTPAPGAPRTVIEPSFEPSKEPNTQPGAERQASKLNGHALETAKRLLAFLNEQTGKNFQPVKANLELILARLKEWDEKQLRGVIVDRVDEWAKDEKMREYLRPATLFNRTKCAQYVGGLPQ